VRQLVSTTHNRSKIVKSFSRQSVEQTHTSELARQLL